MTDNTGTTDSPLPTGGNGDELSETTGLSTPFTDPLSNGEEADLAQLQGSLNYLHLATLAGQLFALPEGVPLELSERFDSTPLPFSEPWYTGLCNYRGELIPVFDLERFLGTQPVASERPNSSRTRHQGYYLIVGDEGRRAALLAESIITLAVPEDEAIESVVRDADRLTELGVTSPWREIDGRTFRELDIYALLGRMSGNDEAGVA